MVDLNIKLPDGFLEEEVRCGYTVTRQMKEVWAVELDLLAEFDRVCKKFNLKYYADAGTLLGTIREKGFVPWDDDIDLCMFRQDYDKLVSIANKDFFSPYKFQSFYTEKNYFRGHAQFRNTNTTCILKGEMNMDIRFNQGIFIDIFVLDGVSDDLMELENEKRFVEKYKKIAFSKLDLIDPPTLKSKIGKILRSLYPIKIEDCFKKVDKKLRSYPVDTYENVAPLNFIFETKKRIRNKHLYDETIMKPFEFMTIPCPRGYDEFLARRYGDYMKPVQAPTTHGDYYIIDTSRPCEFYIGGGVLTTNGRK